MIELEHSPLGGSAAHRFINCAGSFLKQREQIEDGTLEIVESEFAKKGTGAHELGAKAIASGMEPYEFLGEEFNGFRVGWPDGIALDAVSVYFNECMRILARRKELGTLLLEDTLHLPHIHPLLKGTVDFGFWSWSDGLDLRDYKNGEGIGVAAANNKQLLYYGFLMLMADPQLQAAPRDFPCRLGIVQPNFYGVFEEPDVWETTAGHIFDWGHEELLPRMRGLTDRVEYIDEDFVLGDWCQFCPVLLECPKARAAFEEFADASEDFITMLTNDELGRLYALKEHANRFGRVLESTVHARLVGGGGVPGTKLVEKRVHRVWKPGAHAALQAAFGEVAMTPPEIKSPAQIEKLSSQGKALALEWGYKPESNGLSVALESDNRPEAKPRTNATVFAGHAQAPEDMGF